MSMEEHAWSSPNTSLCLWFFFFLIHIQFLYNQLSKKGSEEFQAQALQVYAEIIAMVMVCVLIP